jgi:hypothetical protein
VTSRSAATARYAKALGALLFSLLFGLCIGLPLILAGSHELAGWVELYLQLERPARNPDALDAELAHVRRDFLQKLKSGRAALLRVGHADESA